MLDENATIIVIDDKFKSPSHQLKIIGENENYDGIYIFDLLLTKGIISNRFVEAEFNKGILNKSSLKYCHFNEYEVQKINKNLVEKVNDLSEFLTDNEIKSILENVQRTDVLKPMQYI
ncbi:TPA: type II toxin-antitoxin system RnlB family antitoxin [Staphylococcus aureus]|nr:type II toxin-antitoxin system RnlB family antitoxin [Staphylococcus aureus]HDK7784764.1 type II toxin-antitoxin system RnlB family antitoxin [Staphylococcus aureus]HEH8559303.1 type II toxin-antitoxin system RnlB family antitoxin [Staphylococcus aureus]